MAARNPLFLSDTGGVDTVEDTRLGLGAMMMPGSSSINTQTGLRPGPVDPGAVTATGTADKFVHVAPLQGFIQSTRATAPGMYVATNDAALAIDMLTSNPANATNPRNDLIIAQVTDKFYTDPTQGFTIKQVVGTPSGSPVDPTVSGSVDYFLLARVRVPANATTIVTGNITDLRPGWIVALGGVLPVPSVTIRNALAGKYAGMTINRTDRKWFEVYDGAAWRVQGVGIVTSVGDLAAITDPLTGQLASNTADGQLYNYNGSAWVARTLFMRKTADESRASTVTPASDATLQFTYYPNEIYTIETWLLPVAPGSIEDITTCFAWTGAGGNFYDGGIGAESGLTNATTVDQMQVGANAVDATSPSASRVYGASTIPVLIYQYGLFVAGSAGGTFSLQWAQGTSNAAATILKAGSSMRASRLG